MGGCCSGISSSETTPQQSFQPQSELQPQHSILPAYPAQSRMTLASYNYLEVQPDSIIVSTDHRGEYYVSFTYDALVDGSIEIMFFGTQQGETFISVYGNQGIVGRFPLKSGSSRTFQQRTMIDLAIFNPQELSNANNDVFPLVIGAEAADGSPIYSLAVLESRGNQQYNGRIVKRVMRDILGRLGEIVPIYREEGGQCVVCMESYPNESLIPCNHSVCSRCRAQLPSQKCPICRQRIQQVVLLHIGSGGDEA